MEIKEFVLSVINRINKLYFLIFILLLIVTTVLLIYTPLPSFIPAALSLWLGVIITLLIDRSSRQAAERSERQMLELERVEHETISGIRDTALAIKKAMSTSGLDPEEYDLSRRKNLITNIRTILRSFKNEWESFKDTQSRHVNPHLRSFLYECGSYGKNLNSQVSYGQDLIPSNIIEEIMSISKDFREMESWRFAIGPRTWNAFLEKGETVVKKINKILEKIR